MRAKTTIECGGAVSMTGHAKAKRTDLTEDTASDAASDAAEAKAKKAMAKARATLRKNYDCDEDCPQLLITGHLDTVITCKPKAERNPDNGLEENVYECKAASTWTVTAACDDDS